MSKKCIRLLLCVILFFSCESAELVDDSFLIACECRTASNLEQYKLLRNELNPISIDESHFKARGTYSLLQRTDTLWIMATSPESQNFTIYDVLRGTVVKNTTLDYPPIVIGQTTFKSPDSIYFQNPIPPQLYRYDINGQIKEKIEFHDPDFSWQMPGTPPGLHSVITQGRMTFIDNERVLYPLDPFGYWYYNNKEEISHIAEYNITMDSIVDNFSTINPNLSKAPIEFIEAFTTPFMTHHDESIYVSYPYDHRIYKYDYASKGLIKEACISSKSIERLRSPLKLKHSNQEGLNFQLSASYYGDVNYHSDLEVFTRIAYHERELYTSDGKINFSNCQRTYSLIVFNKDLEVITELNLSNLDLWERALATSNGYMVPGKCSESRGQNFFEYNIKYDLVKSLH